MNPEYKNEVEQQAVYQGRLLELISQGHNTRSAKRKIERENKKRK